jgi:hypothetical protein
MPIQFSVAVRNAQADQLEVVTGATAKLQLRTGSPPANCATAASGTLLAEITLPADWLTTAAAGLKSKNGTWSGTASAAGTAGYFRVLDNAGTTCHMQGTVGQGSGDLSLDNSTLASGQTVTVNTFDYTRANA